MRLAGWTRTLAASAVTILAAGTAAAPAAAAEPPAQDPATPVSVALRNTDALPDTGQIPVQDLAKYGVPVPVVDQIARGEQPAPAADEGTGHAQDRQDVVAEWQEADYWNAVMRRGYYNGNTDSGFGLEKIQQKHNLNLRLARDVTQYPDREWEIGPQKKYKERGNTYRYEQQYIFVRCLGSLCELFPEDRRTVRAIHNFMPGPDGKARGTVTAYCLNADGNPRCPDWVKDSVLPPIG